MVIAGLLHHDYAPEVPDPVASRLAGRALVDVTTSQLESFLERIARHGELPSSKALLNQCSSGSRTRRHPGWGILLAVAACMTEYDDGCGASYGVP